MKFALALALLAGLAHAQVQIECRETGVHTTNDVFASYTNFKNTVATNGHDFAFFNKALGKCYFIHDGMAVSAMRVGEAIDTQNVAGVFLDNYEYTLALRALQMLDDLERKKRMVAGFITKMGALYDEEERRDFPREWEALLALQTELSMVFHALGESLK